MPVVSLLARVPELDSSAIMQKLAVALGSPKLAETDGGDASPSLVKAALHTAFFGGSEGSLLHATPQSKAAVQAYEEGDSATGVARNGYGSRFATPTAAISLSSIDRRSVRFSPKLEYHSDSGASSDGEASLLAKDAADNEVDDDGESSFSREMQSLRLLERDLSRAKSDQDPDRSQLDASEVKEGAQEPRIELSGLEQLQEAAASTPAIAPPSTGGTPRPPGSFGGGAPSSRPDSSHISLRSGLIISRLEDSDSESQESDVSDGEEAQEITEASLGGPPRASTPPPASAHTSFASTSRFMERRSPPPVEDAAEPPARRAPAPVTPHPERRLQEHATPWTRSSPRAEKPGNENIKKTVAQLDDALRRLTAPRSVKPVRIARDSPVSTPSRVPPGAYDPSEQVLASASKALKMLASVSKPRQRDAQAEHDPFADAKSLSPAQQHLAQLREELELQNAAYHDRRAQLHASATSKDPQGTTLRAVLTRVIMLLSIVWCALLAVDWRTQASVAQLVESSPYFYSNAPLLPSRFAALLDGDAASAFSPRALLFGSSSSATRASWHPSHDAVPPAPAPAPAPASSAPEGSAYTSSMQGLKTLAAAFSDGFERGARSPAARDTAAALRARDRPAVPI